MSGPTSVEIRRRLSAPPSRVFDWWTEPDLLERWMTPSGMCEATVDARQGGAFRIVMSGEGIVIEHVGTFLEIDRPRRLVFTWMSPYTGARPSLVTVELEPEDGGGTELRLVHTELPEEAVASHGGGWGTMLGRLEEALVQMRVEVADGD
jgi:uncharacterized protein YndB with AHSA1/START domain